MTEITILFGFLMVEVTVELFERLGIVFKRQVVNVKLPCLIYVALEWKPKLLVYSSSYCSRDLIQNE